MFQVITQQWGKNYVLVGTGIFLSVMALMMVALGLSIIFHHLKAHYSGTAAASEIQ